MLSSPSFLYSEQWFITLFGSLANWFVVSCEDKHKKEFGLPWCHLPIVCLFNKTTNPHLSWSSSWYLISLQMDLSAWISLFFFFPEIPVGISDFSLNCLCYYFVHPQWIWPCFYGCILISLIWYDWKNHKITKLISHCSSCPSSALGKLSLADQLLPKQSFQGPFFSLYVRPVRFCMWILCAYWSLSPWNPCLITVFSLFPS